jgi:chromosome segregation ATPase
MPADEERIQILEFDLNRFKTETIKAYSEMAVELVMLKGLTEDSLKRLAALREQIGQRFDRIETRLDDHARDIAQVEITLNKHTEILSDHTARLDRIETMLAQILARLPE